MTFIFSSTCNDIFCREDFRVVMEHIKDMMTQNLDAEASETTLAILECASHRLLQSPPNTSDIIVMVTTPSDEGGGSKDKMTHLGQVGPAFIVLLTVSERIK